MAKTAERTRSKARGVLTHAALVAAHGTELAEWIAGRAGTSLAKLERPFAEWTAATYGEPYSLGYVRNLLVKAGLSEPGRRGRPRAESEAPEQVKIPDPPKDPDEVPPLSPEARADHELCLAAADILARARIRPRLRADLALAVLGELSSEAGGR